MLGKFLHMHVLERICGMYGTSPDEPTLEN